MLWALYLNLENGHFPEAELVHEEDGRPFAVEQDQSDGSLYLSNVRLFRQNLPCMLRRPLNSRNPWPLYLTTEDDDTIAVFEDDGSFTEEMKAFLRGEP